MLYRPELTAPDTFVKNGNLYRDLGALKGLAVALSRVKVRNSIAPGLIHGLRSNRHSVSPGRSSRATIRAAHAIARAIIRELAPEPASG